MESCLEAMQIGEYLRNAVQHLSVTTSTDIERAQRDGYDERQQEDEY